MIEWEDLATRQINKIPRALPEPIRARATEVPVFFSPARDELGHYFGWDEGQIANVGLGMECLLLAALHPAYIKQK
jgi:hypothetical protein